MRVDVVGFASPRHGGPTVAVCALGGAVAVAVDGVTVPVPALRAVGGTVLGLSQLLPVVVAILVVARAGPVVGTLEATAARTCRVERSLFLGGCLGAFVLSAAAVTLATAAEWDALVVAARAMVALLGAGLVCGALLGASRAFIGVLVAAVVVPMLGRSNGSVAWWSWPLRPPSDVGAWTAAATVLVVGAAAFVAGGGRNWWLCGLDDQGEN